MFYIVYMSRKTYKGTFRPKNPQKYKGDVNKIVYRSGWERKFMRRCDTDPSILQWTSEFPIQYYSTVDKKVRRYFVDFIVKTRKTNGVIQNQMIEIKPHREKFLPEPPKIRNRKRQQRYLQEMMTYKRNQDKWKAAELFAAKHGMVFKVMDQYALGIR